MSGSIFHRIPKTYQHILNPLKCTFPLCFGLYHNLQFQIIPKSCHLIHTCSHLISPEIPTLLFQHRHRIESNPLKKCFSNFRIWNLQFQFFPCHGTIIQLLSLICNDCRRFICVNIPNLPNPQCFAQLHKIMVLRCKICIRLQQLFPFYKPKPFQLLYQLLRIFYFQFDLYFYQYGSRPQQSA